MVVFVPESIAEIKILPILASSGRVTDQFPKRSLFSQMFEKHHLESSESSQMPGLLIPSGSGRAQ